MDKDFEEFDSFEISDNINENKYENENKKAETEHLSIEEISKMKEMMEPGSPKPEHGKHGKRSERVRGKGAYEWLQCVVTALVFVVLVFVFAVRSIGVVGPSMQPTLYQGDNVIVSNLFYKPKAGDVVIITKESYSEDPIVKRIIATEGQIVDIDFEKGIVYVDSEALDEPYIAEATHLYEGTQFPVTVPENCVFVMGDNRNESSDSRKPEIGMIDERCILGKVYAIIVPANLDFSRFGSIYK